jgi:subtilase family serine protease
VFKKTTQPNYDWNESMKQNEPNCVGKFTTIVMSDEVSVCKSSIVVVVVVVIIIIIIIIVVVAISCCC